MHVLKGLQECLYTNLFSADPLLLTPLTCSAMETPENTEENVSDPEPADEGDIKVEY
jgi:hypothetical protein